MRRIISANGSGRHTADVRLGSVSVAHVQEQKEVVLALEAMSRDLSITALIGQVLVAVIDKDMIRKILPDEVPPSSA